MKALWKGSISFGLVHIPIKLYSGTQSHRLALDMVRKKDKCAIQYVRVCKKDGKEVSWEDIAKGYKKENGDYVILDKDDFAKAAPEKTQSLDIFEFIKEEEIPAKYLEKPYITEPAKDAKKVYALLREALRKSGKVGLCKFVMRTTEHLGILKVEEDAILLIQIRFEDELRDPEEAGLIPKNLKIDSKELSMAMNIIDQLTGTFDPTKYKDTYKAELIKMIKKKASAKSGAKEPAPRRRKKTAEAKDDLLEQLKASLAAIKN
ncbi:non-homologous end joining protein Ku [Flavobacterium suzhouense]|uniref:Non-homologous end joining protein Ku n=1 Tax=Flavobacterium suzhouense TaxID=1529638 RepID=A0ABW5NU86_9FLAO